MTSANPGGEPLVTGNDEALARLAGIADAYVVHDRDIVIRCDDSVRARSTGAHAAAAAFQFVRRARGYTPRAIRLARGRTADRRRRRPLQEHRLRDARRRGVRVAAHRRARQRADLRRARRGDRAPRRDPRRRADAGRARPASRLLQHPPRGGARGSAGACPRCGVQHHHAHIAAVVAEHRHRRPGARPRARRRGARHRRQRPGAASCCASTARRASASAASRRSRCPAATAPRASRGGWRRRRSRAAAAPARSRAASPTSRRRPRVAAMLERGLNCAADDQPRPLVRRRRGPARRARGAWRSRARRRCCSKASPSATGRSPPMPSLYRIGAGNELDLTPLAAALADERDAGRGAALFHATLAAGARRVGRRAPRSARASPPSPAAAAASSTPSLPATCAPRSPRAASRCWKRAPCRPTTAAFRSARPGSRAARRAAPTTDARGDSLTPCASPFPPAWSR